jgi:arylsulfatase A-like enzyme
MRSHVPSPTPEISQADTRTTQPTIATRRGFGPLDVLVLSAWCGLAGGLLEVGTRVLCKVLPAHRMYGMSRHFVWIAPLSNLLLFAGIGVVLAFATKSWPLRGGWLATRLVGFLAVLPALMLMSPRIYPWAWAILALGISSRLVPLLERRPTEARRWQLRSFPVLLGVVLMLCGGVIGGDWLKERREASRPRPPGDPPNVLLIVLDTVRADRLSLYGYRRPTTPTLERLAKRGIRFDEARATAPWTLPSHASLFTGRWPHELDVNWNTRLGTQFPTLAEHLGSRGYATAGFVANVQYCSDEFGLDRGFTHYEDYVLEPMTPLRMCYLGNLALKAAFQLGQALSNSLGPLPFLPPKDSAAWRILNSDPRNNAGSINGEFLDWLSRRREPTRPFFAFLNYFDAHSPYMLPPGTPYRFGRPPKTDADVNVLVEWFYLDKLRLPPNYVNLAKDCYDSCLAYLDEKLGELFDELKRRGILERTLVIVAADHGEGLGEHNLFYHGESLYRTEIRVPLLIVPPGQGRPVTVGETVSLRDLPATIAGMAGQGTGAPFPGASLTGLWRDPRPGRSPDEGGGAISELASPNPYDPNQGRSPVHRGALVSLAEGDYVYIRNEGDSSEELFNVRDDPNEFDNRARSEAAQAVKERLRTHIDRLRAGPRPPQDSREY